MEHPFHASYINIRHTVFKNNPYNFLKQKSLYSAPLFCCCQEQLLQILHEWIGGFSKYQKASLWERLTTRKADVNDLYANPLDEFSNPRIGPSDSAVAKYIKEINTTGRLSTPIEVQKLSTGGYEIVNGHHRWLAAQKAGLKRVPIQIKNYNN